jgi:hypothetical protein
MGRNGRNGRNAGYFRFARRQPENGFSADFFKIANVLRLMSG